MRRDRPSGLLLTVMSRQPSAVDAPVGCRAPTRTRSGFPCRRSTGPSTARRDAPAPRAPPALGPSSTRLAGGASSGFAAALLTTTVDPSALGHREDAARRADRRDGRSRVAPRTVNPLDMSWSDGEFVLTIDRNDDPIRSGSPRFRSVGSSPVESTRHPDRSEDLDRRDLAHPEPGAELGAVVVRTTALGFPPVRSAGSGTPTAWGDRREPHRLAVLGVATRGRREYTPRRSTRPVGHDRRRGGVDRGDSSAGRAIRTLVPPEVRLVRQAADDVVGAGARRLGGPSSSEGPPRIAWAWKPAASGHEDGISPSLWR